MGLLSYIFDDKTETTKKRNQGFPDELKHLVDTVNPKISNDPVFMENRVKIEGNRIYINNDPQYRNYSITVSPVFEFTDKIPSIEIYENEELIKKFIIEPKRENPNLKGQFFHSSVRINANSSVQIEGIISNHPKSYDQNGEGIRFQPFFLSDKAARNKSLIGKGMFERGLHFSGLISAGDLRLICICDYCNSSFNVQFYHAGFSEIQYFYSSNSNETLIVHYGDIENLPIQNQKEIDEAAIIEIEKQLPKTEDGSFKYYNNFCCPKCYKPYLNFEENKTMRPNEYYVHFYINQKPIEFKREA